MAKMWQGEITVILYEYDGRFITKPASGVTEYVSFKTTALIEQGDGDNPIELALEEALAEAMQKFQDDHEEREQERRLKEQFKCMFRDASRFVRIDFLGLDKLPTLNGIDVEAVCRRAGLDHVHPNVSRKMSHIVADAWNEVTQELYPAR